MRVDDHSDDHAVLLAAAAAGDADAFRVFYTDTIPVISRYISARASNDVAEDLVSDTYARALRAADTFVDRGRPAVAWLITIARNVVASHYRSGSRPTVVHPGDSRLMATPEDHLDQQIDEAEVIAALADVPARQRALVIARFLEDRSVGECAAAFVMTEQAVRAMTYRGLQALRIALESQSDLSDQTATSGSDNPKLVRIQRV